MKPTLPRCYRCRRQPCRCRDGITLYQGRAESILAAMPRDLIDAVVMDPPYSSGGMTHAERSRDPSDKYVQHGQVKRYVSFSGDNRDQRSWTHWMTLCLSQCLAIVRDSGYLLTFTDWRMLPASTDALQAAGFVWRGLIAWDKGDGARAPHKGYFRHQCEYVTWGTRGTTRVATHGGPWPGCYRHTVKPQQKLHMTGKPIELMRDLVQMVPPGSLILDPFAGSGTTLLAARETGRRAVGIELSEEYCAITARRLDPKWKPQTKKEC